MQDIPLQFFLSHCLRLGGIRAVLTLMLEYAPYLNLLVSDDEKVFSCRVILISEQLDCYGLTKLT